MNWRLKGPVQPSHDSNIEADRIIQILDRSLELVWSLFNFSTHITVSRTFFQKCTDSLPLSALSLDQAFKMIPIIQPKVTPTPTGTNLKGKVCIITGATAGLGKETARQLLVLNAETVVIACRDLRKGEAVKKELLDNEAVKKHNPTGKIKIMKLDLDNNDSVRDFALATKNELPVVDHLILNAGIGFFPDFKLSESGHERTVQVNYLGNAILIMALLSHLEASKEKTGIAPRITWVGSRNAYFSPMVKDKPVRPEETVFGHMDDPNQYLSMQRYHDSKLLCLMFLHELAGRISKERVLMNIMCPGMVSTDLSDNLRQPLRTIANVLKWIRGRSPEQGTWLVMHSIAVIGQESHGRFVGDKDIIEYVSAHACKDRRKQLTACTLAMSRTC